MRQYRDGDHARDKALAAAEKVARYGHALLSAVRLAGDINAKAPDDATLDELLAKITSDLTTLGPLLDLDAIRDPQGSRTEGALTVGRARQAIEHNRGSGRA